MTPILKKQGLDANDLRNFRPVSNLPFVSKILERVVLLQLQSHLCANSLLKIRQSAYRKYHSTETAVLSVLEGLLTKSDQKLVSILALLDLSAAFDTLDPVSYTHLILYISFFLCLTNCSAKQKLPLCHRTFPLQTCHSVFVTFS